MAPEKKTSGRNRIPIKFSDVEDETEMRNESESEEDDVDGNGADGQDSEDPSNPELAVAEDDAAREEENSDVMPAQSAKVPTGELGGPLFAELVATRAELKRVEAEVADLKDRLARRQADFENYRKRIERERVDTQERAVADIAAKLLPVLDNLKRALDAEATVEASESDEFRHFLSGVDLISKQLSGVLEALGVKPILAVGEPFNPHVHEAVVSEPTDEYEPDTVMQEIIRGYRLGDKLIRPSLVKVAVKK